MKIKIKGFNNRNSPVNLPPILWYEHCCEKFGFYDSFTIGFSQAVPLDLVKIIVIKENKKEIEYFVDYIYYDAGKNGFFCKFKIKNNVTRLLENLVKPTVHKTFSLEKMIKKYAKDEILGCKIKEAFDFEIKNFYVDVGMTAFDVIQFFFQATLKQDVFVDEDKNLTFPYFPKIPLYFGKYKKYSNNLITGLDYTSLKFVDNRSKLISNAFVQIVYENNDSDFLSLTEENKMATACNIKRVKYLSVPKKWQVLPKNGSDYIVQKENKNRFFFRLETLEKINVCPGMICKIKETFEDEPLVVVQTKTLVDFKKTKTTIYLKKLST